MTRNHLNNNKQFLIGVSVLAFAVILVVFTFLMIDFRMEKAKKNEPVFNENYCIELRKGFIGDSIAIYLNDSLLFNNLVKNDTLKINVRRFAEQNALIINTKKDQKATTFNLSEKGGRIILIKADDIISMTSTSWQ